RTRFALDRSALVRMCRGILRAQVRDGLTNTSPLARIYRPERRNRTLPATRIAGARTHSPASHFPHASAMSGDVKIERQLRICLGIGGFHLSAMTWREYHGITKHSVS